MKKCAIAIGVAAAWFCTFADATYPDPISSATNYTINVTGTSVTNTYSGKITLTDGAKLIKTGAGTLALTCGENELDGGILLSAGKLRADVEGCLGTGKITFDTSSNRQLIFNAPNATFPNDIEQVVYYAVAWNVNHIKFDAATTLSGNITSPGGNLTLEMNTSGAHVTFTGSIDMGEHGAPSKARQN